MFSGPVAEWLRRMTLVTSAPHILDQHVYLTHSTLQLLVPERVGSSLTTVAVSYNDKVMFTAKYLDTDSGKSNHKNPDNASIDIQVAFGAYKEHE